MGWFQSGNGRRKVLKKPKVKMNKSEVMEEIQLMKRG